MIKPILLLCLFLTCLLSVSDEETSRSKASSKKVSFNLPEQEEEDSEGEDIGDILGGKSQSKISETKSSFEKRQEKVSSKDYYLKLRSYLNYQLMWVIMNIGQFVLPEDSWNQSQCHDHYGLLVWSNPVLQMSKKIEELENSALAEKPWQLSGEVTAQARPENSLLEEDVEFEQMSRTGMSPDSISVWWDHLY